MRTGAAARRVVRRVRADHRGRPRGGESRGAGVTGASWSRPWCSCARAEACPRSVGVLSRSDSLILDAGDGPTRCPGSRPGERERLALVRMHEPGSGGAARAVTTPPPAGSAPGPQRSRLPARGCARGEARASRREGRPLRVKLGIDPTAPDIHVGHTVVLTKLREFQDAGHTVVLIVGDYTARVGDPSGRSVLPAGPLGRGDRRERGAHVQEQAGKVLRADDRLEVRRNSEWLDMPMDRRLPLARRPPSHSCWSATTSRGGWPPRTSRSRCSSSSIRSSRATTPSPSRRRRARRHRPDLQPPHGPIQQSAHGQPPQVVLTLPLLTGIDGMQKMSKSLGNHIGVTDHPGEIYGRTMRIPDERIAPWVSLVLGEDPPVALGPRDAKRGLARALIARFHYEADALEAEAAFDRVFIAHELPAEIEEAFVAPPEDGSGPPPRGDRRRVRPLAESEARRSIAPGRRPARTASEVVRRARPAGGGARRPRAPARQAPLPPADGSPPRETAEGAAARVPRR